MTDRSHRVSKDLELFRVVDDLQQQKQCKQFSRRRTGQISHLITEVGETSGSAFEDRAEVRLDRRKDKDVDRIRDLLDW